MSVSAEQRESRLAEMMRDPNPWWRTRLGGLNQLIKTVRPRTVLEIGCCRGHSTELFLMYAEHVIALDPWPTDPEDPYYRGESLDGMEYDEFTARCSKYSGLDVVRGRSPDAVHVLAKHGWRFDLVYIDGEHTYEAISADIAVSWSLCRTLAGHDWSIPGVRHTVIEHCLRVGLESPDLFSDDSWLIKGGLS